MEALSIVGLLVNVLSLGRMVKWRVRASAVDVIHAERDGEKRVPTLHVDVCNIGKDGITLYPLEYRILGEGQNIEPYNIRSWKEHDGSEEISHPRLESGEMRISETQLPLVRPREAPMLIEVMVKTHCGKRAKKVVKNHSVALNDLEINVADGRDIKEYLKDKFPNFPI